MVSTRNQRLLAELSELRPTRQSRIGLRTQGLMVSTRNQRLLAELSELRTQGT
jgi:hypothetical protein